MPGTPKVFSSVFHIYACDWFWTFVGAQPGCSVLATAFSSIPCWKGCLSFLLGMVCIFARLSLIYLLVGCLLVHVSVPLSIPPDLKLTIHSVLSRADGSPGLLPRSHSLASYTKSEYLQGNHASPSLMVEIRLKVRSTLKGELASLCAESFSPQTAWPHIFRSLTVFQHVCSVHVLVDFWLLDWMIN